MRPARGRVRPATVVGRGRRRQAARTRAHAQGRRRRTPARRRRVRPVSLARGLGRARGPELDRRAERGHPARARSRPRPRRAGAAALAALRDWFASACPCRARSRPGRRPRAATSTRAATASRTSPCCTCATAPVAPTSRWSTSTPISADGTRALDWWFPSDDGALVAYGVSDDGSEESVLRVRDVATGRDRGDEITRTRACSRRLDARRARLLLHALSGARRGAARRGEVPPRASTTTGWATTRPRIASCSATAAT